MQRAAMRNPDHVQEFHLTHTVQFVPVAQEVSTHALGTVKYEPAFARATPTCAILVRTQLLFLFVAFVNDAVTTNLLTE